MLRKSLLLFLAVSVVILARSAVFVFFEGAHFDSDQAVLGLMARDLSHFRAFPFFIYGQKYLLGLEAWLAAPGFAVWGPSVAALKVPILLVNLAVAWLLIRIFTRECGLSPVRAILASSFFILPPVIPASRLVEAGGGNVEPFLFVLLLWCLRERPWLAGSMAGLAYLNRPFVLYGILAISILEWRRRDSDFWKKQLGRGLRFAGAFVAIYAAGQALARFSSNYFGGDWGRPTFQLRAANVAWLFTQNLASLLGYRVDRLEDFNIRSTLSVGHWGAGVLIALLALSVVAVLVKKRELVMKSQHSALRTDFPAYLMWVGIFSLLGYVIGAPMKLDRMVLRYNLLFLCFPIGAFGWLWLQEMGTRFWKNLRRGVTVLALLWLSLQAGDHARLLHEYATARPGDPHRELTQWLDERRVPCGSAPYWASYHVSFLADERVKLQSIGQLRVSSYAAEGPGCVRIREASEPPECTNPVRVARWNVCQ